MCKQNNFVKAIFKNCWWYKHGLQNIHNTALLLCYWWKLLHPFCDSQNPSVFLSIIYINIKDTDRSYNGCPLDWSYLALCGSIGCTDDFTPDLAVFSSCEYSQYSWIELGSPGCNAVRVMNLMTGQQPDLKAHAWQKTMAAYQSKPGHLFSLVFTCMAANMV